jgi:hypothetical protein
MMLEFPENATYHACKHASITPHVQTIIVFLEINKQFRSFKVSGSYANIVFCARVIKFCQTPIDQTKL